MFIKYIWAIIIMILLCVPAQGAVDEWENALVIYESGDYKAAFEKMKALAEKGSNPAQFTLGVMYENGQGVARDYKEAVKWYRSAADKGYAEAQFNLGGMYLKGIGVLQDNREAAKWLKMAAEQGHDKAQNNLGGMYFQGKGVIQDLVQAHMWANLAVINGNGNAVKGRETIEAQMSPDQITEANRLANEWMEKHKK
jgi:TPR repeat protein